MRVVEQVARLLSLVFRSLFALVGVLFLPAFARAATISVTSAADNTTIDGNVTLREAITSIDNGADLNTTPSLHWGRRRT